MSVNSTLGDMAVAHQPPLKISNEEADPLLSSNMFSNPARYDSDGEDSPRFDSVGAIYSPYSTNSPIRAPQTLPFRGRKFQSQNGIL